jgi:hypothetical protein
MFNEHQDNYLNSGKTEEWGAYKAEKQSEYAKKRREMLSFLGKHNPQHDMYQSYISSRARSYQNIVSDPGRKSAYREKAKNRQAKFRKSLELKKKELIVLISKTRDPKKIEELQKELLSVESKLEERKHKVKEIAKKVKEKKESGQFGGLIVHLSQKLASFKKDAKSTLKNVAKKDPYFNSFKNAVRMAKEILDKDNSPANQVALSNAIKAEDEAIQNYLINHPTTVKIIEDLKLIYAYRDKLAELEKTGWMEQETMPDEVKPHLNSFIDEGNQLITNFAQTYRTPMNTIQEIIKLLSSKL